MKVDRLVSMIMILLEKERVGARELAQRFEVSPRTIYRDMEAISLAGIPVRSVAGVGGGFEIMPEYKLDKKVFSAADLSAILMGLSSLSSMVRGQDVVNALAKVKSFVPADKAKDIALRANQICVDLGPWMGNRSLQPSLETIKTALQESRLLSFSYVAHHGRETERTVEPYQLVLKNSHWYLQGYCRARADFRLFKLSRISNLRLLEAPFSPRAFQEPILDFAPMLEPMQTEITLRVHRSILDMVLEYCTQDRLSPDGGAHYLVRFPFVENDYFYNVLFSFGAHCECLAPPRIRAEMKRRSREIAALYGE